MYYIHVYSREPFQNEYWVFNRCLTKAQLCCEMSEPPEEKLSDDHYAHTAPVYRIRLALLKPFDCRKDTNILGVVIGNEKGENNIYELNVMWILYDWIWSYVA